MAHSYKFCAVVISIFLALNFSNAQEAQEASDEEAKSRWQTELFVGLNFSNTGFSNWSGGGQNAINIGSFVNLNTNIKDENATFDNSLGISYRI